MVTVPTTLALLMSPSVSAILAGQRNPNLKRLAAPLKFRDDRAAASSGLVSPTRRRSVPRRCRPSSSARSGSTRPRTLRASPRRGTWHPPDCAAVYGGGRCEEILGAWLRDAAPAAARAGAVVVTKGGCGAPDTPWAPLAVRDR
ncbi:hypothetical protein JL721_2174 [Aureococcus anophagefferens]|nr:hypothetical protein JL721_2174 [Aureococcus anophagefferens]